MADARTPALSDVLDRIEESAHGDSVQVRELAEHLGRKSFASVMLVCSLLSASPASAIPGLTAAVGAIVAVLAVQMLVGRECVWLPGFVARRHIPARTLRRAIGWLRRPVQVVERFSKPRLSILLERPWIGLPLLLTLGLALFMPFMEVVPTSGSIASALVAVFAAGLLLRDGGLVLLALLVMAAVPVAVWHAGIAL
jgi:hypothetical protein